MKKIIMILVAVAGLGMFVGTTSETAKACVNVCQTVCTPPMYSGGQMNCQVICSCQ
jgi:hypothetical protein